MDKKEISCILDVAKTRFLENEVYLLNSKANERSITHKFAEYLQKIFSCYWDIDCEYNRYGNNSKKKIEEVEKIVGKDTTTSEIRARTIYPDIIVHKRGKEGSNLLVIEAKKDATTFNKKKDIDKLKKIKKEYNYKFACFLNFSTKDKDIMIKFINQNVNVN